MTIRLIHRHKFWTLYLFEGVKYQPNGSFGVTEVKRSCLLIMLLLVHVTYPLYKPSINPYLTRLFSVTYLTNEGCCNPTRFSIIRILWCCIWYLCIGLGPLYLYQPKNKTTKQQKQTKKQKKKQTNKQTKKQSDKQINTQTNKHHSCGVTTTSYTSKRSKIGKITKFVFDRKIFRSI